jgi:signal peptidase I
MLRSSVSHLPRHKQSLLLAALFIGSVLAYLILSRWVFLYCEVEGDSMRPALENGDRRLAHRWLYLLHEPQRGDVVALRVPGYADLSVKRIIALPGETVSFEAGHIFIDGRELHEAYLSRRLETVGGVLSNHTYQVAAGCYFVLGDNREVSADSRHFGAVPRENLLGRILSTD